MTVSVPSVPGRTQRVLIDKRNGAKATNTAARLYKKPLQNAGHQSSKMSSASTHYTSFIDSSKSHSVAPFGSKDLRFDGKLELQEYFNRDPGPGTYDDIVDTVEEKRAHDQQKLVHPVQKGKLIERHFNSKQHRFH